MHRNGQSIASILGSICYLLVILLCFLLSIPSIQSQKYLRRGGEHNAKMADPLLRALSDRQKRSYHPRDPEVTDNLSFAKIKHRRLRKNKASKTSSNFDAYNNLQPNAEAFDDRMPSSEYNKYGDETRGQLDYYSPSETKSQYQQFDEPHPDEHNPEKTHQMLDEVKKLEDEIRKLEQAERASAVGKPPSPNTTIRANISFPLKWKQYRNLTDVDTMDLKYEVSGKDTLTVQIIFFIILPSLLLILFLYLAITLYWTKCWFWRVVPPDRFYKFERYEIEQDEDPSDLAPLLKMPLQAAQDAEEREQARLESAQQEYQTPRDMHDRDDGPKRPQRKKDRDRGNGTDDDFGISDYDTDGRGGRSARTRDRTDDDSTDRETERQRRKLRR